MSKKNLSCVSVFSLAKGLSAAAVFLAVSQTAIDVGLRRYTGVLIDSLTAGEISALPWGILAAMAALLILLGFLLPWTKARLAGRVQEGLFRRLEEKALLAEQTALEAVDPGQASTYFASDVTGVVRYLNRITGFALPDLFIFTFSVGVLCAIHPGLGLAAIGVSLLPMALMFFMSKTLVRTGTRYQEAVKALNQKIAAAFHNLEFIKASALEETASRETRGLLGRLLHEKRRQAGWEAVLAFPAMLSAFLTILLLALYGGHLVLKGSIGVGELFTAIALSDYIVSPVMRFDNTISQIRRAKANFRRLSSFLSLPEEEETTPLQPNNPSQPVALTISHLNFSYPGGKIVFENACFHWAEGTLHAIVGENGAGKSTLLKLLSGVYLPQGGSVTLEGTSGPFTRQSLREKVIIDTQQTLLFPGTLRYNLTLGRSIPEKRLMSVCKAVGIATEIEAFPEGMETLLGEEGNPLSGGQKRRLCIARALLREGPVYIFDEPTTGIDPEHIRLLAGELQRLSREKLVLVLTHEPLMIGAAGDITKVGADQ